MDIYYIYLGKKNDFSSPEQLIVFHDETYFYRQEHTDWFVMDETQIQNMNKGLDNKYYCIEEKDFNKILSSWGGSKQGYKSMNINSLTDNEGYGDEYDE